MGPYCAFSASSQVGFTLPEGSKSFWKVRVRYREPSGWLNLEAMNVNPCIFLWHALEETFGKVCLYLGGWPGLSMVYWILGWGRFNITIRTLDTECGTLRGPNYSNCRKWLLSLLKNKGLGHMADRHKTMNLEFFPGPFRNCTKTLQNHVETTWIMKTLDLHWGLWEAHM